MDGDKEVCLVIVGNLCPAIQLYESVGLSGVDDFYVRTVTLNQLPESEGELQCQVLLLGYRSYGACVASTVPGVYDQREPLVRTVGRQGKANNRYQQYCNLLKHQLLLSFMK